MSTVVDREAFVNPRRTRWKRLDRLVTLGPNGPTEWAELASEYRAVCADLASARALGVPADVVAYIDEIAGKAHNRLYSVRPAGLPSSVLREALHGFPRELRAQLPYFLLASLLFYGPLVIGLLGAMSTPEFAARVLPESQLQGMESAYAGDLARGFGGDASMAGFYVWNNVGIAFRVFATGVLFGLGPLFYLVYNGLVIGTVMGYVTSVGHGGNLFAFVSGHSAWELTGVCVAGAAGLRMGWALVSTGGLSRLGSLAAVGPVLYRLVLGTVVLLLVAASIEGFWSAGPAPAPVKLGFGAVQVAIVAAWLTFGGRRGFGAAGSP